MLSRARGSASGVIHSFGWQVGSHCKDTQVTLWKGHPGTQMLTFA